MCTVCETFLGTCDYADEGQTEIIAECGEIDMCYECGWWCEVHEFVDEDMACQDCRTGTKL